MRLSIRYGVRIVAFLAVSAIVNLGYNHNAVRAFRKPVLARSLAQADQRPNPQSVTIDAAITGVVIVGVGSSAIGTQLTIWNISNKKIMEVHAYLDRLQIGKRFWGILVEPIAPSGSLTLEYNYEPAPHSIKLAAIVFEDGTGEGDQKVLRDALAFSAAYRQEQQRNIDALSEFIQSNVLYQSFSLRDGLSKLRQRIESNEPLQAADSEPDAFALNGRHAARTSVTGPLENWETSAQAIHSSNPEAAVGLLRQISRFIDRAVALDERLRKRTAERAVR